MIKKNPVSRLIYSQSVDFMPALILIVPVYVCGSKQEILKEGGGKVCFLYVKQELPRENFSV